MGDEKKSVGVGAQITDVLRNPSKVLEAMKRKRRERPDIETPYAEPRTETEKRIAEICSRILDIDRVGVNDSLLELGAESLILAQISAQISDSEGVEVSFQSVFDTPVVASLAQIIEGQKK